LQTGRTHQIRVHLSEIGHPIVGDITYGYSVKKQKENNLNRFYLHAAELGFIHPRTSETMKFSVPWPLEDQAQLALWGL
jgi:23S rRNA pseudouridine1911/1915/1917 synthase